MHSLSTKSAQSSLLSYCFGVNFIKTKLLFTFPFFKNLYDVYFFCFFVIDCLIMHFSLLLCSYFFHRSTKNIFCKPHYLVCSTLLLLSGFAQITFYMKDRHNKALNQNTSSGIAVRWPVKRCAISNMLTHLCGHS